MENSFNLARVAFSPGEFAALFGKSQTWGYRKIYSGAVKAITEQGRILIPAAEVERILATAARYEGTKPKKVPQTKEQWQRVAPQLQSAWQIFVQQRRKVLPSVQKTIKPASAAVPRRKMQASGSERQAARARLIRKHGDNR